MPVEFRCTNCRRRLRVPRRWAGDAIDCPRCAAKIVVPQQEGVSEAGAFESKSVERALRSLEPAPRPSEAADDAVPQAWDATSLATLGDADFALPDAKVDTAAGGKARQARHRRLPKSLGLLISLGLAALASAAVIGGFWLFQR